jgi:hypothetical protein
MSSRVEELAVSSNMHLTANGIANTVFKEMEEKYSMRNMAYHFLTKDQLVALVYRLRQREFGSWEGLIRSHPYRSVSENDKRLLVQFNVQVNIDDEYEQVINYTFCKKIYIFNPSFH